MYTANILCFADLETTAILVCEREEIKTNISALLFLFEGYSQQLQVSFMELSLKTNVLIRIMEKYVTIHLNIVWNTYAKGAEV